MTVSWFSAHSAHSDADHVDVPHHVDVPLAGGSASLRPLRHGETEPLLSVFEALSPASRASRYLVGMTRLPSPMRDRLVAVDDCDHVAWLATVDGVPAGIARYVRVAPDTAEVAFEVVDAHHGRGLGTALLDVVTTVAQARGVRRVRATVLPTNTPSLRLLSRLDIPLTASGGVLEGEAALRLIDPPRVDRRAVLALAMRRTTGQDGSCTGA